MRVGLVSIYSFRPHVEHLYYLSTLLKKAGHELFFLTCNSALDNCYARSIKGTSKLTECPACIAGGVRSFPVKNVSSISSEKKIQLDGLDKHILSFSTACTLARTETQSDVNASEFQQLETSFYSSVETAFGNAVDWIAKNKLDGVICFNGRMDATRAITLACERQAVPFLTLERTWFGDGLQLVPQGNCLSLRDILRLNAQYKSIPLTYNQAQYAAQLIASRFVKTNLKEWRTYNLQSTKTTWPSGGGIIGPKVLLLPSSRNEFDGHPDYESSWDDYGTAFDLILEKLCIAPGNVVLRCHPNWGERIGTSTGEKSENYYVDWARKKGIHCIGSKEPASTFDLIQDCDILLVNGSTAALEAGACGKKIICLGHSFYEDAGIAIHLIGHDEIEKLCLDNHSAAETIRNTLRYAYTMARRFAQYVDYVQGVSSTTYRYFDGANPNRIIKALMSGVLEPDDEEISIDDADEKKVISLMMDQKWDQLAAYIHKRNALTTLDIGRRYGLRWLDGVREKLPRGDVWHGK